MSSLADHIETGMASPRLADPETLVILEKRGYRLDGQPAATGRPGRCALPLRTRGGVSVMAKLYGNGKGEQTFTNMRRLWLSPFGRERSSPGLPEPLDYIPEAGALIMEQVAGRPLVEFGRVGEAHLTESMRLLSELHTCGVVPEIRRKWRGILRSLDRKLQRIKVIAPQSASPIELVVERLRVTRVKDTELVCAHGDFSARNVLIAEDRALLIDWDRLQQADPARDVAYFAVWPWREAVRRGRMPDRKSLSAALETYRRFRPACHLRDQVAFHVAAALVRMCCSLIELWPEQRYLVPGLARAAARELDESR